MLKNKGLQEYLVEVLGLLVEVLGKIKKTSEILGFSIYKAVLEKYLVDILGLLVEVLRVIS